MLALLDNFFTRNREVDKSVTGAKIRKLRIRKNMSALELGEAAGVAETAIRNYETGYRNVSDEKLPLIAKKLGVPTETLLDRQINSYADVIHILFELSESYEFIPTVLPQEPKFAILTRDENILEALKAWYEKRRQWEQGQITLEQFQEWKDAFPLLCEEEDSNDIQVVKESSYTDFERILGFKSEVESINLIVNAKVSEALASMKDRDYKMVQKKLEELQSTVDIVSTMAIKKFG